MPAMHHISNVAAAMLCCCSDSSWEATMCVTTGTHFLQQLLRAMLCIRHDRPQADRPK